MIASGAVLAAELSTGNRCVPDEVRVHALIDTAHASMQTVTVPIQDRATNYTQSQSPPLGLQHRPQPCIVIQPPPLRVHSALVLCLAKLTARL